MFTGTAAQIEALAGDPAAAAELVRDECEQLEQLGEQGFLSTASAYLAQLMCELDRLDEAEEWAARARELGPGDDVETQYRWRLARAVVLARRGEGEAADELAREAVALADTTDNVDFCAGAYASLGDVLDFARKPDQAADARREALARYEQKGSVAMGRRLRKTAARDVHEEREDERRGKAERREEARRRREGRVQESDVRAWLSRSPPPFGSR